MITNYFWFFLGLAALMALQIYLASVQSKAFMASVRELRRTGSVAIGLGGRRWFGRKVYVAIATDGSVVTGAVELRGITQFARPEPVPALVGQPLTRLAGDGDVEGADPIRRLAVRQAAETLCASGGWQPAGDASTRKETDRTALVRGTR